MKASLRGKARSVKRQQQIEIYAEFLKEFHIVRDLWRNSVMHARATYNEPDAIAVFGHVRSFMQRLADQFPPE